MDHQFAAFLLLAIVSCITGEPTSVTRQGNSSVSGTFGCDVSSLILPSTWECLKGKGIDFAVIRAYRSDCSPDSNAIHTIANARQAGIKYVDVYMFPSPHCSKSASEQVKEMVGSLTGIDYGQIWLDIEGSQYWLGSASRNQAFFEELLKAAKSYKPVGVYASSYQWSSIMGSSYTGGSGEQLWYAHYDNNPSFSDFSSFGGWSHPAIKQYAGDASLCGADIDRDWY